MTTEEFALLDRIERLAYMAGQGNRVTPQEDKPKIPEDIRAAIRACAGLCLDYPSMSGTVYCGNTEATTLTWAHIRALAKYA